MILGTVRGIMHHNLEAMGAKVVQWQCTRLPPLRSAVQIPDLMWESWYLLTDGRQFTLQNLDQRYAQVSSAHKTVHRDMTCTVLKVILKGK